MTDHLAGELMCGERRLAGLLAGEPRRQIAGVEAIAGRGRVDRHDHLRHRDERALAAGRDQRTVRAVLHDDLGDTERLHAFDCGFRAGVAPQHGLVVIGRQRDIDALERLEEHRTGAGEIAAPAARAEVAVEGDLDALLARHFQDGEETADAVVGIKRQRDAGEIDELGLQQSVGHLPPIRQFEQFARWRRVAPEIPPPLAVRAGVDDGRARQPASDSQHQVARRTFRRRQRHQGVRIWVVPNGGRQRRPGAGARQIDRDVEGIAARGDAETAVAATYELDERLADTHHLGNQFGHAAFLSIGGPEARHHGGPWRAWQFAEATNLFARLALDRK